MNQRGLCQSNNNLLPSSTPIFRIIGLWMLLLAFEIECRNERKRHKNAEHDRQSYVRERVSSQSKRSPRAREFFPKGPSLQCLVMDKTVNSYGYPSASKSMPSANSSEPSSMHNIHAYGNTAEQYLGIVQSPSLLKLMEVKGESSSKHAVLLYIVVIQSNALI
jgi:hypothetical protein